MPALSVTINGQKYRDGSYNTTDAMYCGVITNTGESTKYYNFCLKFKTPKFSGKSQLLSITMNAKHNSPKNSTVTLRYALCKSDANFSKYQTSGTVTDTNQITTGTAKFTVSGSYSNSSFTISTNALASETTYYLIIYSKAGVTSSNSIVFNASTKHSIIIAYVEDGGVRVCNGTNFDKYKICIYDGSNWNKYIPYIYNGSGWDKYS